MFDGTPITPPTPMIGRTGACTHRSARRLAPRPTARYARAGQIVAEAGNPIMHQLQVISGMVMVYRDLPDGARQIVDFLTAGDFVEPGATGAYRLCAIAIGAVELACHDARPSHCTPDVMRAILASATAQLARQSDHVTALGCGTAEARLALALHRFATPCANTHADAAPQWHLDLPISRQALAEFAGVTAETVSRTLSRWKARGIIRALTTRAFLVLDTAAFVSLSGGTDGTVHA